VFERMVEKSPRAAVRARHVGDIVETKDEPTAPALRLIEVNIQIFAGEARVAELGRADVIRVKKDAIYTGINAAARSHEGGKLVFACQRALTEGVGEVPRCDPGMDMPQHLPIALEIGCELLCIEQGGRPMQV
jgi:hypothetical protein